MADASLGPIFEIFNLLAIAGGGALVAGGTIAFAPRVVGSLRQRSYDRATERERRRWVLRLDPSDARDRDAGMRFVMALHPGRRRGVSRWSNGWPQMTLAVASSGGRARWEVEAPRQLARSVETAIAAAFPGAEVEETEPREDRADGLRLGVRGAGPSTTVAQSAAFGTLLTELLARLPSGAEAVWSLTITPRPESEPASADDRIGWVEVALDSLLNRSPRHMSSTPAMRPPESAAPTFSVSASLEASSATPGAIRAWLFDAVGTVCSLRGAGWRIEASVGGRPAPMRLDATAVAELWGLAAASSDGRAVDVVRSRRLRAPIVEPGPAMRPIAMDGGRAVLVPDNLFSRHLFVLGRTGAGKSTELVALAADDLQAGRGFTFIDPHGDAVARLLDAVPEDQAHRVHLLELAEKDRPRAFNPIELDGADPELVAAQFVDTMRDLYFATLGTAHRQVQYLRNALMTLLTMPSPDGRPWTLESLYSLFVDPAFRDDFTRGLKDPVLTAFWKHQWQQGARGGDPSADAIVSKLGAFLGYPSIRAIVSAPVSTIRPRQIMDSGDVLLVDLSGVGRDHMRLFGSLVIARFNVAALGRQRVPAADRTPHALYVDEVQNFDTTSLRSTPAEGRKFGLQIHMATQYMRALGQELQSAIRANVATTILLQPSAEDVRLLGDLMAPLTERDLVNLPRFRMAIRTELDGESTVMTADVLPEPEWLGFGGLVRRLSDERDGQ